MKQLEIRLAVCLGIALSFQPAFAQNQPGGHIVNIDETKCTFTQTTVAESYLHSIEANTGDLEFDDPNCMGAEGLALEVNELRRAGIGLHALAIIAPYSVANCAT